MLTLASRSPQRRAILEQLGIPFSVVEPEAEELREGDPDQVAVENAYRKAASVAANESGAPVLGVDTIVYLGRRMYGKPANSSEAISTLLALSNRRHVVVSGLCLIEDGHPRVAATRTFVVFRDLHERLIQWYMSGGEWRERAGAYAIQGRGAAFVSAIEGDYLNVVGLPVSTLLELAPDLIG